MNRGHFEENPRVSYLSYLLCMPLFVLKAYIETVTQRRIAISEEQISMPYRRALVHCRGNIASGDSFSPNKHLDQLNHKKRFRESSISKMEAGSFSGSWLCIDHGKTEADFGPLRSRDKKSG